MYEFGTDLDDVVNKMQTALSRIDSQLPEGVDPQVIAGSTDDLPAVVLAATGTGDERALAEKLRTAVVPELEGVEGVRTVEVTGTRDDVVLVTPDPAKLAAAQVQPTAIGAALKTNGVAVPAGAVTDGALSLPVQVGTPIATLDDLRGIVVSPGARPCVSLMWRASSSNWLRPPRSPGPTARTASASRSPPRRTATRCRSRTISATGSTT